MRKQVTRCDHIDRRHRALGLCNACYLKQNGGSRNWYARNKQKVIANAKAWATSNLQRRREIALAWTIKDNKQHPEKHAIRERIRIALKGNPKSARITELLGCSIAELRSHLETQFQDGMSWNNHEQFGWHIDHIKPCASFDLSDPQQQRQCFHYTNLQPLWWLENLKKGATSR